VKLRGKGWYYKVINKQRERQLFCIYADLSLGFRFLT
jgi:hypothetical protein